MSISRKLHLLFIKDKKYLRHNAIYCARRWMFASMLLFIAFYIFHGYDYMLMGCFCILAGIVHYLANLKGIRMIISIPINRRWSKKYKYYMGSMNKYINDCMVMIKDDEHNVI